MLRNKEFSIYFMCMLIAGSALLIGSYLLSKEAFIMVAITEIVLGAIFVLYTRWRYKEIERLSGYLREISSGHYGLDVRNNFEGELSILRNEIFKVTERLAEQSNYMKHDKERLADAIADISHQLKTPLASMQVMLDLLEHPNVPNEKRVQFLSSLQIQLERMEWLITSLLKLSKLDAGTVHFQVENVEIINVVKQALQSIEIPIELKEIQIEIQGKQDAELQVDVKWMTEAIINVVKNAVEHTPIGGAITLTIRETFLYTELTIEDTGVGIPKADLPHLFKRFYKGKHSGEASIGIGLALTHSIMQSQNGLIEVSNGLQSGAVFTFKWYKRK